MDGNGPQNDCCREWSIGGGQWGVSLCCATGTQAKHHGRINFLFKVVPALAPARRCAVGCVGKTCGRDLDVRYSKDSIETTRDDDVLTPYTIQ